MELERYIRNKNKNKNQNKGIAAVEICCKSKDWNCARKKESQTAWTGLESCVVAGKIRREQITEKTPDNGYS